MYQRINLQTNRGILLRCKYPIFTADFTKDWQKLEKGIITGCTLSVILFALSMTMLVSEAEKETKGPKMRSGQEQRNSRLFMDDVAITTETLVQT